MIQFTKLGLSVILGFLLIGFSALGYSEYKTVQIVKNYQPVVLTRTILVTPTIAPTATPAAVLRSSSKVTPLLTK